MFTTQGLRIVFSLLFIFIYIPLFAQKSVLKDTIMDTDGQALEATHIHIPKLNIDAFSMEDDTFHIESLNHGNLSLAIEREGYKKIEQSVNIENDTTHLHLVLQAENEEMETVVISGTMKVISRLKSPVPVEVYTNKYFKANPTPSIFDALSNVNGVRPQLNCNICNTGDIHINGLEGPYTMILIDGMPIVSGLSSVYGLSGIPQSMVDRIEVVKGPASTLYGSEAVGGLINVITKTPEKSPIVAADLFTTSWAEINADIATKIKVGKKTSTLLGINYFNYQVPIDKNNDNFTDVTLQNRISIFNKWVFERKHNRLMSIGARYIYEDRWGGEMQWAKKYRGSEVYYGESIYTNRVELMGTYQLPVKEHIMFQWSANKHDQNSMYGTKPYMAKQNIAFGQLTWNKTFNKHDVFLGATYRYTYYDDNTPATIDGQKNQPSNTYLPGVFLQDQINLNKQNILLLGLRYDYNSIHGSIVTPRINYKWNSADGINILRVSGGNGYRVANVFTEDHASLTGARKVEFRQALKPEKSWNGNVNYIHRIFFNQSALSLDASAFYTYFTNKIIPDYDTDVNKIIYSNLDGHAVSKGISLNLDYTTPYGLQVMAGATLMDVSNTQDGIKTRQMLSERFSGTWNIGYHLQRWGVKFDYTGNIYGPMRLPLLGELDPRPEYSPWWSIQNIQITKTIKEKWEVYGGIKNLLNWTPNKSVPFLIARPTDPFDKQVQFDGNGQAIQTANNPYGLTFDPSYQYAPNQGLRFFLGFRYTLN